MELIEQIWSALHTATLPDLGVWSYVILFVLIFIEGPAITMTAGAMAGAGILRFDLVFFTAVVSNTLADYTWYLLGYFGSQHPLLLRLRWIQHNEKLIQRLTIKIQRRASHLFLVAKASVGIMSIPVLVASGIARVSWLRLFVISVIFEPIWNRNYVDHVQITVAEEVKVGRRGGYYDKSSVLRDMFQNHLFQLMMVTAMEAPVRYTGEFVRDEKVKVLQAVRPYHGSDFSEFGMRGQYQGYLDEEGVPKDSQTETFAALKFYIDNWRWRGVPFYLRSGKAMSCRTTQIVIQFREPPHLLFGDHKSYRPEANRLVIQIQPAEGLQMHFQSKVPDSDMRLRLSELDFRFDSSGKELPDAYQRLLLDAMVGDPGLFARSDEVEQAWRIMDPIIAAWRSPAAPQLFTYESGMWGPSESTEWMERQGRSWFDICPVIH